jgi:prefoldin subunit 5
MSEETKYSTLNATELRERIEELDSMLTEYSTTQTELRRAIKTILNFAGLDVDEVVTADVESEIRDWVEDQLDNLHISR